ncbi:hypothetical protein DSL72_001105 [Monilinia vaccinii-corymbosi]|uniref:Uncharacterized protein n=1 Tax=Monilinia vaccinii-corymbosi TaxID=61207 RepID=A0A8A3P914_9HELO|nr:hypothetical protein DSL72_001105 [Monilinia vaccinii-corymbosi]
MYNFREATIQDPSSSEANYLTDLFDGLTIKLTTEGNQDKTMEVQEITEQACHAGRKRKYEECAARAAMVPEKRKRRRIDAGLSVRKFITVLGGWTLT